MIPAGKHSITWKFEPESFIKGSIYSSVFSFLTLILFLGISGFELNKKLGKEKLHEIK
jgi:hypothetical protein